MIDYNIITYKWEEFDEIESLKKKLMDAYLQWDEENSLGDSLIGLPSYNVNSMVSYIDYDIPITEIIENLTVKIGTPVYREIKECHFDI